jgi:MoaA/NifB/PqqE/SkfB family radical SAM enzyme
MNHLILTGGEAFVWPHIKELVETALDRNPNVKCSVVTNGSFINEYWRNHVRRGFFRKFNISFNAGTLDNYKKVHGRDHFERVLQNIDFLAEQKKTHKLILNVLSRVVRGELSAIKRLFAQKLILDISCVLSRVVMGELSAITRLFAGKVDTITFQELNEYDAIKDYYETNRITEEIWPRISEELDECNRITYESGSKIQVLSKYKYRTMAQRIPGKSSNVWVKKFKRKGESHEDVCPLPWTQIIVNASGHVSIGCCQSRHVIGNIENESIEKILENPVIERLQKEISKGNVDFCPLPRLRHKCPYISDGNL